MSQERYTHLGTKSGRCEAPQGCNVTDGLTVDHFTPKCIAKLLGWSRKQIDQPANRQLLCWDHHKQKDSVTPQVKEQVRFQLKGGFIPFGQHIVRR